MGRRRPGKRGGEGRVLRGVLHRRGCGAGVRWSPSVSSGYVSRSQERSCALGVALEGGLVGIHVGVDPQRPGGVRTVVRGIRSPRGRGSACVYSFDPPLREPDSHRRSVLLAS